MPLINMGLQRECRTNQFILKEEKFWAPEKGKKEKMAQNVGEGDLTPVPLRSGCGRENGKFPLSLDC